MNSNNDPVHTFLLEAHNICVQAQFIVDSLPNAELPAVERSSHQLGAVRQIVTVLEDLFVHRGPSASHSRLYTGRPGCPSYVLDLPRARLLHDLGNSYEQIAQALGVDRKTLYWQLEKAGIPRARRSFTAISDEALDEVVSEISLAHPFVGSVIVSGHLESRGIHLPRLRVQDSLRRVDEIDVLVRWAGIIKGRVYKVRVSNALWHHDGNEKLRPWGFYVHGCRKMTVANLFQAAVAVFGWPRRMRGDFGTENNEVERLMILYWGMLHRAYLRGRSRHNVRIERLWRDVRKDALETFRQIFDYLEKNDLLDMENPIHSTCLFLVFQRRIQAALDRARDAWNHHRMRTQHDKTPIAIYELSRTAAITQDGTASAPGKGNSPRDFLSKPENSRGDARRRVQRAAPLFATFPQAAVSRVSGMLWSRTKVMENSKVAQLTDLEWDF
ncbi:Integrase catalytic domain-containing protein [Favolaschia claudopus]|uniref:Integrase catalytic domain-containing protein n=1 Tax=Favolaschia claudopus TaxID=2862362 RepID=A0AAW0E8K4_9AGAR